MVRYSVMVMLLNVGDSWLNSLLLERVTGTFTGTFVMQVLVANQPMPEMFLLISV